MDDVKFDEVMREAGAVPQVRSTRVLQLAEESRARSRPVRRRRPVVIAVAVGGALLLAAATSTAALMKIPPFQSIPAGMYRTQASIAVDYRSITGHENHCLAFLEFMDLSVPQADAANALVKQHDWTGIGQTAYDRAATGRTDPDAIESRFTDLLGEQLHSVAITGLPGIAASGIDAGGKAAWSGWSMSCKGGQH
jgi:hypothetical protein